MDNQPLAACAVIHKWRIKGNPLTSLSSCILPSHHTAGGAQHPHRVSRVVGWCRRDLVEYVIIRESDRLLTSVILASTLGFYVKTITRHTRVGFYAGRDCPGLPESIGKLTSRPDHRRHQHPSGSKQHEPNSPVTEDDANGISRRSSDPTAVSVEKAAWPHAVRTQMLVPCMALAPSDDIKNHDCNPMVATASLQSTQQAWRRRKTRTLDIENPHRARSSIPVENSDRLPKSGSRGPHVGRREVVRSGKIFRALWPARGALLPTCLAPGGAPLIEGTGGSTLQQNAAHPLGTRGMAPVDGRAKWSAPGHSAGKHTSKAMTEHADWERVQIAANGRKKGQLKDNPPRTADVLQQLTRVQGGVKLRQWRVGQLDVPGGDEECSRQEGCRQLRECATSMRTPYAPCPVVSLHARSGVGRKVSGRTQADKRGVGGEGVEITEVVNGTRSETCRKYELDPCRESQLQRRRVRRISAQSREASA
ncbi:unnamed protein product [Pleuronectes platessa]|uniref:Uncharacterized protein n=1 Tax=Pleuronectes platessa TaxID=8262 RepID=A0A9N7YPY6_PLEPL|nr:unnamed protein product [Pleuronectes platessa]